MKLRVLAVAVLALGLTACSDDKDEPKNCTGEFIDAYNELVYESERVASQSDLRILAQKCFSFKDRFGNQSCRAGDIETGGEVTVNTNDMDCAAIQKAADN